MNMLMNWQGMWGAHLEGNTVGSGFLGLVPAARKIRRGHSLWLTSKCGFCTALLKTVTKGDGWGKTFPNWVLMSPHQGLTPSPKADPLHCPSVHTPGCFPYSFKQERDEDIIDFFSGKNRKHQHSLFSFLFKPLLSLFRRGEQKICGSWDRMLVWFRKMFSCRDK